MIRISRVMLLQAAVILAVVIAMSRPSESCTPCQTPDTESTGAVGNAAPGSFIYEMFDQADSLSTAPQTSFAGMMLQETQGGTGTNSCYWSGDTLQQQAPTVLTYYGTWTMGSNDTWGTDDVGLPSDELDDIVTNGPAHGISFPCTMTVYQQMDAQCSATGPLEPFWVDAWTDASGRHLDSNKLTVTISINPRTVTSCRDPGSNPPDQDCATFPY